MEPTQVLTGRRVLRVVWLPGSDYLQGNCHCGAVYVAEDPVEIWKWLLAHPVGHQSTTDDTVPSSHPGPAAEPALTTAEASS